VIKNRTFFFTALEGYRTKVLQGLSRTWPSARQRNGDFSTTRLDGRPVRIFNPYCRGGVPNAKCPATGTGSIATGGEFTNAIIPRNHPAASAPAFNMANLMPLPLQSNEDSLPNQSLNISLFDVADMWTFKGEHKFSNSVALSGLYVYNRTSEPGPTATPDELSYLEQDANQLVRHPKIFVMNNTNVLNDSTVLTLRYGWTTFPDGRFCEGGVPGQGCYKPGFASLGFSPTYANQIDASAAQLLPSVGFQHFSSEGQNLNTAPIVWRSPYAINGSLSILVGSHTWKMGGDAREMSVNTAIENATAGSFSFSDLFTSGPGRVGGA
jgi:hypothetical protein